MRTMSRNAESKYILRKQEDYIAKLKRSGEARMLDGKYVFKLLRGGLLVHPLLKIHNKKVRVCPSFLCLHS